MIWVGEKRKGKAPDHLYGTRNVSKSQDETEDPSESQCVGNSLVVQWLGVCTSTAGGMGSIPGRGTKILHATWPQRKKERKKERKRERERERERGREGGREEGRKKERKKESQCVTFSVTSTEIQRSHPDLVWNGFSHHHHT